jgi:tetratricopeptide (TPR) repeat protein
MKSFIFLRLGLLILLSAGMLSVPASAQNSHKPALKRDTAIADGKEETESAPVREHNPKLAVQNINIGNQYFKNENYAAAISRYLEALEYNPDSIPAYAALVKAYEKNGDIAKAVQTLKTLIEKHPEASKAADYRVHLAQLEKKSR